MNIVVSACLLGTNCKYNGGNNYNKNVYDFVQSHTVIPVCPEVQGGLSIPREACEICNNVVIDKNGISKDKEFREGARICMEQITSENIDMAILKSNSPSCGFGKIYDGHFSKTQINGNGIFAELLIKKNIKIITENDIPIKE